MQPTLTSERLLLRPVRDEDLDSIFSGLSNPAVIKHYGVSYRTREEAKDQLRFYKDLIEKNRGIFWALCSPDDRMFYGTGGYFRMDLTHRKAELGLWLFPEYWGRSFLSEALVLICKHAFDEHGLHRLEAMIETDNDACRKGLTKLPFTHEGTLRECELKNGKFISLEIWSLLEDEFRLFADSER